MYYPADTRGCKSVFLHLPFYGSGALSWVPWKESQDQFQGASPKRGPTLFWLVMTSGHSWGGEAVSGISFPLRIFFLSWQELSPVSVLQRPWTPPSGFLVEGLGSTRGNGDFVSLNSLKCGCTHSVSSPHNRLYSWLIVRALMTTIFKQWRVSGTLF